MTRFTLGSIHDKLELIEQEIKDLKTEKVGTEVWHIQHEQIKLDIREVKHDIANINSYGKWFVTLVGGTIIVAVVTYLINGGLAK
jgi:hypothetical protein